MYIGRGQDSTCSCHFMKLQLLLTALYLLIYFLIIYLLRYYDLLTYIFNYLYIPPAPLDLAVWCSICRQGAGLHIAWTCL
jgi:hypothetical protein